ncbi:MAG: SDR family oxidoreductase [Acidimicrobiia bacterium]|nr:SDR family oxidoreductase [Acidimicrobiia bacterium]MBV9042419.1 SDR family oxidoreductase [Acidimicrobiia bacterium]
MLLEGKNAVITGSASGVGRASALRFVEEGARVVCADLDADGAKETVRQIEEAGGTAVAVATDVSKEGDVAAAIQAAVEHFGRLDIMFNNVGIPTPRLGMTFTDHSFADYQKLAAVNFGGVFLGCKYAVEQFKKQGDGGVILNTGSVAGLVGWGGTVYGATKGAVVQLTRAVAVEVAPENIRVNALCPGAMPYTGFMAAGGLQLPEDQIEQVAQAAGSIHPMGRPVTAEDCAEAAVFLCSDRAKNITGVLLPIDGGYVAK